MSEKPILFNGAMVRAIREGRKTQTRRPVKPQPELHPGEWLWESTPTTEFHWNRSQQALDRDGGLEDLIGPEDMVPFAPYAVGDRLWVRETWGIADMWLLADAAKAQFLADETMAAYTGKIPGPYDIGELQDHVVYRADNDREFYWRPSIHMPKWAARLWLEVTDVRVERVQDIGASDVEAEGVLVVPHLPPVPPRDDAAMKALMQRVAHRLYVPLWDSLYAKQGLGWEANPWVWVYTFRVLEGDEHD